MSKWWDDYYGGLSILGKGNEGKLSKVTWGEEKGVCLAMISFCLQIEGVLNGVLEGVNLMMPKGYGRHSLWLLVSHLCTSSPP